MSYNDKQLICSDCSESFLFSGGEQSFFATKGLQNEPKRCPNCRILMRVKRSGRDTSRTAEVKCAECEKPTRVPFQPKGYKPVYCSYCFQTKKQVETTGDIVDIPVEVFAQ